MDQTWSSLWDCLSDDMQNLILQHRSTIIIQRNAYKMFYNKYGIAWKNNVQNYDRDFDYYLYVRGINDPYYDYCDLYKY